MRYVPNILSLARLILTIPVIVLILINTPASYLAATVLYFFTAVSDTVDGRIARRYNLVTRLGVFLDLAADKVFVCSILIALVQVARVPAWIAIVIVAREFVVSGLRSLAAADGVVIPAGRWGKQKTFLTLLSTGGILLASGLGGATAFPLGLSTGAPPDTFADYLLTLSDAVLLLAVLWTILSAVEYIRGGWKFLMTAGPPPAE
ncbi:MAG TPA: CDP-diacylglycerol--glycerol-3-phosphate 3-phosphatidyltransferase [Ktedonobacterales bacterium]|nr:CDP-diacylglycerol--glycerol-3-phosphate 3-phosphatidyltransferase [Ktedonobacterales bacterium]